jgi:hypothetical protein
MPRMTANSLPARFVLVATGALLLAVSPAYARTDFNGNWELDLRASSSPDAVLKRLGASWVERQLGGSLKLQATYSRVRFPPLPSCCASTSYDGAALTSNNRE